MKELNYRGERIVQIDFDQTADIFYGFEVKHTYTVLDDFDEFSLPTVQHQFWTPHEAMAAVDVVKDAAKWVIDPKRWPSTAMFEYNVALRYRQRWGIVYATLLAIEAEVKSCEDFDENPSEAIKKLLADMRAKVMAS